MLQSIYNIEYYFYILQDSMISYAIFILHEEHIYSFLNLLKTTTEVLSTINHLIK